MQVAVTGTPGTGKSSVAEELEKRKWEIVDLTDFIEEQDLGTEKGKEREVRVGKLTEKLEEEFRGSDEDLIIEGHLAHHYPADYCVVLRCKPDVLRERLSGRKYDRQKVEENIEAESMDIVLQESVKKQENIIEIDTTSKKPEEAAEEIERRVENGETGYGEIDWTEFL